MQLLRSVVARLARPIVRQEGGARRIIVAACAGLIVTSNVGEAAAPPIHQQWSGRAQVEATTIQCSVQMLRIVRDGEI